MKRWQAILIQIGISLGLAFTGRLSLKPEETAAIAAAGATLAGSIANATSKSNPDGTPASLAFKEPKQ